LTTTVALLAAGFTPLTCAAGGKQTGPGWVQPVRWQDHGRLDLKPGGQLRVEDGALVADKGKGGQLVTRTRTELHDLIRFWSDEKANSGIFIPLQDPRPSRQDLLRGEHLRHASEPERMARRDFYFAESTRCPRRQQVETFESPPTGGISS